jgi:hypothetical protein
MQTIELSENSIQILDKQQLTENSILIVKVDVGNMPARHAMEYMENIKTTFAKHVEPANLVIMSNKTSIELLENIDVEETNDIVQVEKQDGRNIFHINVPDHFTNEQLQTMINKVKEKHGEHQ